MDKKVLFLGKRYGRLRTETIIDHFISRGDIVYFTDNSFYLSDNFILKFIGKFVNNVNLFFLIHMADIIYVLPQCHHKVFRWIKLSKRLNKKIVVDYFISSYDTNILDRGLFELNSKNAMKFLKYDKNSIMFADHLFFLNKGERDYYCELAGVDLDDIKSYSSLPLYAEIRGVPKLPYYNDEKDFITICWWGTYIPLHGIESIIMAFKALKKNNIKFSAYLFGNNEKKSKPYEDMIESSSLGDCVTIRNDYNFKNGKLEKFLINNADIILGNFGESKKAKTVLVTKVVEASSFGFPIISQKTAGAEEFFTNNKDITFSGCDPSELSKTIIDMMKDKDKAINMATKSRDVFLKHFTIKSFTSEIDRIIGELSN